MSTLATHRDYLANAGGVGTSFSYLWDATGVALNTITNVPLATGKWRPLQASDFSSSVALSISGLSVTVDNVAVTGGSITLAGGTVNVAVTGTMPVSVVQTGQTAIQGGTFAPTFAAITGSQIQIPVGAKLYSIGVESGSAFINGVQFNQGASVAGGGYDGRWTLGSQINVGCTGGRVILNWEV